MLLLVSHVANLFNLCPFPDSAALYVQNWFPIRPALDHNFPVFWIVDPIKKNTMPPWGIVGLIVWAYVHSQMNPQTCTKFGANRSSRLPASPAFWMCDPLTPRHAPWGIEGWLVFGLCQFPDDSADVNQSWCQSVQTFDSFPWLWMFDPPKPPPQVPPCVSHGNLFGICPFPDESAHVYHMWCQSDRRLTSSPDFWFCDPLFPPPPPMSRGELYLAYVHS